MSMPRGSPARHGSARTARSDAQLRGSANSIAGAASGAPRASHDSVPTTRRAMRTSAVYARLARVTSHARLHTECRPRQGSVACARAPVLRRGETPPGQFPWDSLGGRPACVPRPLAAPPAPRTIRSIMACYNLHASSSDLAAPQWRNESHAGCLGAGRSRRVPSVHACCRS